MSDLERNSSARNSILGSIREHLAASVPFDAIYAERKEDSADLKLEIPEQNGHRLAMTAMPVTRRHKTGDTTLNLVDVFRANLEAVGGHCRVAQTESEVAQAVAHIIVELQTTPLRGRRIALSNAAALERLMEQIKAEVEEVAIAPGAEDLFNYDIGISNAQAAIAETGTLVLESEAERHRLVSLIPPVHIAILEAGKICLTLGEMLEAVGRSSELSPTITFITGPSRTADIELTLAIGVHGPQELFVIINTASAESP